MAHTVLYQSNISSHMPTFPKNHTTFRLKYKPLLNQKFFISFYQKKPFMIKDRKNSLIVEDKCSSSKIPYWTSINSEIEAHLNQVIPHQVPLNVYEPMCHLTFSSPKSMAPALCVAACELVGGHRAQALPAASALYVMHAAVQVHDYLPLTDRPRPMTRCEPINHVFSSGIELLTGDGLLSFGYELLAGLDQSYEPNDSGRVLRVIIEVSRAMGSQGVVEGQFREVECCQEACQEGWLRKMYEKKNGELHSCGAACGAILGGASDEEVEKLKKYGLYVGTINGLLHGQGNNNEEINEIIQSLRQLALKELKIFDDEKISSFMDLAMHNFEWLF